MFLFGCDFNYWLATPPVTSYLVECFVAHPAPYEELHESGKHINDEFQTSQFIGHRYCGLEGRQTNNRQTSDKLCKQHYFENVIYPICQSILEPERKYFIFVFIRNLDCVRQ